MSIFDLFRGFFGVPGGPYGRHGPREPFFDSMTHDEDEEDDDGEIFFSDPFERPVGSDQFDDSWRFGFSMGPNGMRIQEPPMFGQILREMEDIFSELGRWENQHGPFGMPRLEPPQGRSPNGEPRGKGSSLRDFMLKSPDDRPSPSDPQPSGPSGPSPDSHGPSPDSRFHRWSPFSKFHDSWRDGLFGAPLDDKKEDGDLDSQVSSGGLDQILTPTPAQPRTRGFFQSVTVKKIVKPDGTTEETRTVRDSHGNEKTTVTRSGGPSDPEGSRDSNSPLVSGPDFSDMQDNMSMFSRFFGGFRG